MDGRGEDDRRMHEGVDRVPGKETGTGEGKASRETDTTDREQESALGGDVATRSGTEATPEEERTQ